jgi:16S rRNA (adenine1518-N6/adenine1519-N6)-dimethyltransferase
VGNGQPLGQHWLKHAQYLDSIAETAELTKADTVLEIGPGQGDLSFKLAKKADRVIAVEIDDELIESFGRADLPKNLEIIASDFRDFNLDSLPTDYKVVANIPYYLTGEIIRTLLAANNRPSLIVLLVQKEVAERAAAGPGKMSVLGVTSQLLSDVSLGVIVPPSAFIPPPKVDSQVVIFRPLQQPRIEVDTQKFFKLVKLAFAMKRKKLTNSLASIENSRQILEELDLADMRPQELNFEQWRSLYERVYG